MREQLQLMNKTEYVSWLMYLPRGIERLKELGIKRIYPAEYLLAAAGEHTRYCYVILSGRVISSEYSESGEERIYSVNGRNSLLLEENLLFDYEVPVNIRTTVSTELVCIDRNTLIESFQENFEIAVDVLQSLSMKLLSSVEQMKCMNEHSAMQKVCNLLLAYAKRYGVAGSDGMMIREKLSQEYIANLLGLNRVTIVRVMKDLKQQGLVEKKNGYYYLYHIEQMYDYKDEKWA